MISNINLNPKSGEPDIINVFIVYRFKSFYSTTPFNTVLFGNKNINFDKNIAFLPSPKKDLVVSNGYNYKTIGPSTGASIGSYKNKANCSELNK